MIISYSIFVMAFSALSSAALWQSYKRDTLNPFILLKGIVLLTVFYPLASGQSNVSDDAKLVIALAGTVNLIALDILFILSTRRKKAVSELTEGNSRMMRFWLIVWILGWGARAASLATGNIYGTLLATQLEVNSTSNLFGMANSLAAFGGMGYLAFSAKHGNRRMLFLIVGAEVVWNLISGSKIGVIYALIPILYIAQRKGIIQVKKKHIAIFGVVALLSANYLFVTITAYRISVQTNIIANRQVSWELLVDGASDALFSAQTRETAQNIVRNHNGAVGRTDYVTFFGRLYDRPDLWKAYDRPGTLETAYVWWIPRVIWPDKPINSVGNWFGQNVFGWSGDSRSQAAITIWGDGLMNLGVAGIFVFPLLLFGIVFLFVEIANRMGLWGLLLVASIYTKLALSIEATLALTLIAMQVQYFLILIFRLATNFVSGQRAVPRKQIAP